MERNKLTIEFPLEEEEFYEPEEEFEEIPEPDASPHLRDYFDVPEKTPEELKGMSLVDRYDYAKALQRQRDYQVGKGFWSGLTLGGSEYIPGMDISPQEEAAHSARIAGELAPIGGLAKAYGLPIYHLASKVPRFKGAIWNLANMARGFFTGATYESAKEAIGGDIPDINEVFKRGGEFAAFELALGLASQIPKMVRGIFPKRQAEQILGDLVKEAPELDEFFQIAETMGQPVAGEIDPALAKVPRPVSPLPASPLDRRVIPTGKRGNVERAVAHHFPGEDIEDLGPELFRSEKEGGDAFIHEYQKQAKEGRDRVKDLYDRAEFHAPVITDIHPALADELMGIEEKLRLTVHPSPAERKVQGALKDILNKIVHLEAREGEMFIEGYKPISTKALIKTSDSLSSMVAHEPIYGDAKKELGRIARKLNESARRSIKEAGGDVSYLDAADEAHGNWARRFRHEEAERLLEKDIRNPEKLYRRLLEDEGAFRSAELALGDTPEGMEILSRASREIIEKKLEPFFKSPGRIGDKSFNRAIENLRDLVGEENVAPYVDKLERLKLRQARPEPAPLTKRKFDADVKRMGRVSEMEPEQVLSKLRTPKGVRELKERAKKIPGGKNLFDDLLRTKMRDILQKGKIGARPTGKQMFEVLRDKDNFHILEEMVGKEEAKETLTVLEKIGKSEMTVRALQSIGKKAAMLKFIKHLWPLLLIQRGRREFD